MSTTATADKPTFVFVPGAWHKATCWSKVVSLLSAQGYKSLTPTLLSTTGDASATVLDDITAIRSAITSQTTQGRDVVVVVWSYGTIPGGSAFKGLTKGESGDEIDGNEKQKQGHVIGYIAIATGFAITGLPMLAAVGGKPPPFWSISSSGFAEFTIPPEEIRELFYNDLPLEEGRKWVGELTKHSLKSLAEGGEYVYAGWMDVECWYLMTLEDRALSCEMQRGAVEMARRAGREVVVREVESGHAPMLSRPERTAEVLVEAAKAFVL